MQSFVYIGTSLDGFIARTNGELQWLEQFANEEAVKSYEEFMKGIDAIAIGRGTFEKVLSFPSWPYSKTVYVISSTIKMVPKEIEDKVTVLALMPAPLLEYLADKGHHSVYVDGGKLIQSFLKEDLIDEMIISRAPILIGNGISLFGSLDHDLSFKHLRTQAFSNGLVQSHYERRKIKADIEKK